MIPSPRSPRALGLPAHDELTAIEHAPMLRLNGFELAIDEDAPVGHRVKLVAQPVSKDTVFGVSDLEELLDLVGSAPAGEVVRPTKARRMFASRACRKSVMVGKALNANQMRAVVRHMGTMEQPWVSLGWFKGWVRGDSLTDAHFWVAELPAWEADDALGTPPPSGKATFAATTLTPAPFRLARPARQPGQAR